MFKSFTFANTKQKGFVGLAHIAQITATPEGNSIIILNSHSRDHQAFVASEPPEHFVGDFLPQSAIPAEIAASPGAEAQAGEAGQAGEAAASDANSTQAETTATSGQGGEAGEGGGSVDMNEAGKRRRS